MNEKIEENPDEKAEIVLNFMPVLDAMVPFHFLDFALAVPFRQMLPVPAEKSETSALLLLRRKRRGGEKR